MYQVKMDINKVNLIPSTELEEILQNVKNILNTTRGSVPLDRGFGVDRKMIDIPISVAKAKLSAAIVEAINKQEPRARVKKIYYEQKEYETMDGTLKPCVDIEIIEERLRGYVLIEG